MDLIFRNFGRLKSQNNTLSFGRTLLLKHDTSVFKITKFRFENPKFRFEKSEVSVRKPEVLIRKPEVFEPETFVKVPFWNASVAETQNFELLCIFLKLWNLFWNNDVLLKNYKIKRTSLLQIKLRNFFYNEVCQNRFEVFIRTLWRNDGLQSSLSKYKS
jgi:hypothetical protein